MQKSIKSSKELGAQIKRRRQELGLTIEEAASKAGVGTKTWFRYEDGESIRKDKFKGVCRALNWKSLPEYQTEEDLQFCLEEYTKHKAWSQYIQNQFGDLAAISFVIGSDLLLDWLQEDLAGLASMPKGSHLGQLEFSCLAPSLPKQFFMQYDYDFLYRLRATVLRLRQIAHKGALEAKSVLDELALYLISEQSQDAIECMASSLESAGIPYDSEWKNWVFDFLGDMDLMICLYDDAYLTNDHIYHFEHWPEKQFWKESSI